MGVKPLTSCVNGKYPIHKARRSAKNDTGIVNPPVIVPSLSLDKTVNDDKKQQHEGTQAFRGRNQTSY